MGATHTNRVYVQMTAMSCYIRMKESAEMVTKYSTLQILNPVEMW